MWTGMQYTGRRHSKCRKEMTCEFQAQELGSGDQCPDEVSQASSYPCLPDTGAMLCAQLLLETWDHRACQTGDGWVKGPRCRMGLASGGTQGALLRLCICSAAGMEDTGKTVRGLLLSFSGER